jgi:hypothetical protein
MPDADFYPQTVRTRNTWHQQFASALPSVATKYNVSAADVARVQQIADWYAFWVGVKDSLGTYRQGLTAYFASMTGKDTAAEAPEQPGFVQPTPPVADPPPGIEKWTRDLARHIKGNSQYSDADGAMLGIGPAVRAVRALDELKPNLIVLPGKNFQVGVKFRKYGMDGLRLEYRGNDDKWVSAGVLLASPGHIKITPSTPNQAEGIQLRAIYMKRNDIVGNWSDIVDAVAVP